MSQLKLIIEKRRLILSMAKRQVASQYVGSWLGVVWTFIQPLVMICVFWFVFSVGFKSRPMNDVPFVVWLTAGMAPWFAFSDIVIGCTGVISNHAHLIKKTIFPSQILPIVHLVASLVTHGVFLLVLIGLITFQGLPFSWYYFQFLYYLCGLALLALGLGWGFAALRPFLSDIGHIVTIMMQIGFWATPIFWDINMMSAKIQFWLKLNPMYYIIQGYRDSFIGFVPFWHHPFYTLYFWLVTGVALVIGTTVFKKLKPQFADVL
jgi:ABC-type polysaccharide/polyol phosphate export permease